jgi:hypothetical protein
LVKRDAAKIKHRQIDCLFSAAATQRALHLLIQFCGLAVSGARASVARLSELRTF